MYLDSSKSLYILTQDNFLNLFKIDSNHGELEFVNASDLNSHLDEESPQTMVNIFPQTFYDTVYLITKSGDCIKLTNELEFKKTFKLFDCPQQILAAEISSNEEHVVLVSDDGWLYILNKHFELEKKERICGFDEHNKILECVITWRFDSEYFSINDKGQSGNQSMTYTRDLKEFHTNSHFVPEYELVKNVFEKVDPTLQTVSKWVPNGSLIYGVRRSLIGFGQKTSVLAWEKNCLHYKEFLLPDFISNEYFVKDIIFNRDSIVMFVWVSKTESNESNILVYTRSNADWHFKINLPTTEQVFSVFTGNNSIYILQAKQVTVINYGIISHTFEYCKNG